MSCYYRTNVQASFLALLSWYRTCSLTTERVLLLQNVFAYDRMCSLTIKKKCMCRPLSWRCSPCVPTLFFAERVLQFVGGEEQEEQEEERSDSVLRTRLSLREHFTGD